MKDPDLKRILDFIRPSFRSVAVSAGFCLILGLIFLIVGGDRGVEAAALVVLTSAAVLAIPAWMEWSPYFRALGEFRQLRDDPAMLRAIVKDFDTAPAAFQGDVRVGGLYLFGKGSGAMIRREPGCRVVYGKLHYKGGWCWRVAVKTGDSFTRKLLELDHDKYPEDFITSCVGHANALLAE